jgi:preprotein translocase subunit Sec61beta
MTSRVKRRKSETPMPSVAAGLLRFYEEETAGIKVRPEVIVIMAITITAVIALAPIFF